MFSENPVSIARIFGVYGLLEVKHTHPRSLITPARLINHTQNKVIASPFSCALTNLIFWLSKILVLNFTQSAMLTHPFPRRLFCQPSYVFHKCFASFHFAPHSLSNRSLSASDSISIPSSFASSSTPFSSTLNSLLL